MDTETNVGLHTSVERTWTALPVLTFQEGHALSAGEPPLHLFLSVYTEWKSPALEHLWAETAKTLGCVCLEPTASGVRFHFKQSLCCQPPALGVWNMYVAQF